MNDRKEQLEIARRHGARFVESPGSSKLGIAVATLGARPINGLRHHPEGGTCGWYIWCGETLSSDPEFFQPYHVSHLAEICPEVIPYLGLAQGWRFLLAPNYEDVWFDESLLESSGA